MSNTESHGMPERTAEVLKYLDVRPESLDAENALLWQTLRRVKALRQTDMGMEEPASVFSPSLYSGQV